MTYAEIFEHCFRNYTNLGAAITFSGGDDKHGNFFDFDIFAQPAEINALVSGLILEILNLAPLDVQVTFMHSDCVRVTFRGNRVGI